MMIHDVTALAGAHKKRKRIGRGPGSGTGKRAGRGQKGAGSRSGTATRFQYEGGQMPYFRRLPKFGFTNAPFKTRFWIVNLRDITAHPDFARGGEISTASLVKAGLVRDDSRPLKILGGIGEDGLKGKFTVKAERVSASARKLIEGGGGSVVERGSRRDKVRGIDRNSEDRSPKNLTKKLHRSSKKIAPPAEEAAAEEPAKGAKKA